MTKQKFSELLLSRFMAMDHDARFAFLENMIVAGCELQALNKNPIVGRIEELEEFSEWASNLTEILFPEIFKLVELNEWDGSCG